MKSLVVALGMVGGVAVASAAGPIASMRAQLAEAESRLAELGSVPAERQDPRAIDRERSAAVTYRHLLSEMERSVAIYTAEHDIRTFKLGDKVRSPVITGEFIGAWGLDWNEPSHSYGQPLYKFGIWDWELKRGVATVRITVHRSASDALEEVLIGGALPAPPPFRGIGDVGFSRDPESSYKFVRDNCLVRVLVRPELGYRADEVARRVDAMILASPLARDPAHPTATLEPGIESRLMPKVKRDPALGPPVAPKAVIPGVPPGAAQTSPAP